ncbi:hypothetical protein PVK06_037293 [Gossypium arboreum]|uniref:Oxysterol-binding protein-related protein 2A-like n=1 Tax=Gossypium arboreum TaxID=29729 RepID=A0ABR0MXE0_GOSAR|nr:hypothetical protein PVK06_037293 [Gossypium arboreum]
MHGDKEDCDSGYPQIKKRKKLPDPVLRENGVSLWSLIKDNVGKDLTRVCLPVYFNEPISSLQKCFEDLEYSDLLDRAYKYGKEGNSLQRILNVAAFAVSGYSSSEGRHCKPFNPLLGETFEADYPEKGVRFFSEVSHHPTLIAFHCEGKGWKFWGDSNLRSKFSGRSIQLDPDGVLTLEFDDGETFQWSKVTTNIYNLILGQVYCDHHGLMQIRGNSQYSCKLKFKEQSLIERNPHQVHGFVEDHSGKKVATLFGKWDDSMYYVNGEVKRSGKPKVCCPSEATLLWKRNEPAPNPTRYNLTSFAITLNEITPGLQRAGNLIEQIQRNNGWKGGKECRENYKKVAGNLDGSGKMVMEATTMWADIGKQESRRTGMDAQIYLVNSTKKLLIPLDDNSTRIQHLHPFRSNMRLQTNIQMFIPRGNQYLNLMPRMNKRSWWKFKGFIPYIMKYYIFYFYILYILFYQTIISFIYTFYFILFYHCCYRYYFIYSY